MANKIVFEDETLNGNLIELNPDYVDVNDQQGIKLVVDIKGDKKLRNIHLSREDAKQMMKWFIDILG